MARRTKAEAEATRHQILDAAEREFLARGVAHTRLQDVAAAAGVTRGAIYWHFEDKAALFNAMMERAFLPCEAVSECIQSLSGAPLEELAAKACWPLHVLASNEQVQRVFRVAMHQTEYTQELAAVQERYLEGTNEFQQDLAESMSRARAAGLLHEGLDLKMAALGLYALVDGLMHHWTLRPGGFDLVACGEAAVQAYVGGLRAPAGQKPHESTTGRCRVDSPPQGADDAERRPGGAVKAAAPAARAPARPGRPARPARST